MLLEKAGFEVEINDKILRGGKLNIVELASQVFGYITENLDSCIADIQYRQLWKMFSKSTITNASGTKKDLVGFSMYNLSTNMLEYWETSQVDGTLVDAMKNYGYRYIEHIEEYSSYSGIYIYSEYRFNGVYWDIQHCTSMPAGFMYTELEKYNLSVLNFIYESQVSHSFEHSVIRHLDCRNKQMIIHKHIPEITKTSLKFDRIRIGYDIDDKGVKVLSVQKILEDGRQ